MNEQLNMGMGGMPKERDALSKQVGGDHYKNMAIQPAEYAYRNKLNNLEGGAVKYVSRHRDKNGAEDLYKAIHLLEMLIEWEYGVAPWEK